MQDGRHEYEQRGGREVSARADSVGKAGWNRGNWKGREWWASTPSAKPKCDHRRVPAVNNELSVLQETLGHESFGLRVHFRILKERPVGRSVSLCVHVIQGMEGSDRTKN